MKARGVDPDMYSQGLDMVWRGGGLQVIGALVSFQWFEVVWLVV